MKKHSYSKRKIEELIERSKESVDIMLDTLNSNFDFEDTSDSTKLKSFIESKMLAFSTVKTILLEIEKLEERLIASGGFKMEAEKEFDNSYMEGRAKKVS